jgi:hypothetical protein
MINCFEALTELQLHANELDALLAALRTFELYHVRPRLTDKLLTKQPQQILHKLFIYHFIVIPILMFRKIHHYFLMYVLQRKTLAFPGKADMPKNALFDIKGFHVSPQNFRTPCKLRQRCLHALAQQGPLLCAEGHPLRWSSPAVDKISEDKEPANSKLPHPTKCKARTTS